MRSVFHLLLAGIFAAASLCEAQTLSFSLEPPPPQRVGDRIAVSVRFDNRTDSSIVAYPSISPRPSDEFPDTVVAFKITGPDGRSVPTKKSAFDVDKRKLPTPDDFREIAPGTFFGQRVYLTIGPFAHDFRKAGIYTIGAEAEYRVHAVLPSLLRLWTSRPGSFDRAARALADQAGLFARGRSVAALVKLILTDH